jgi:spermidine/putrescine transport system substrate-binding protein
MTKIEKPTRRDVLKYGAAAAATTALCTPYVSRAWAQTVEINMLAWYGHGEPDMVGAFEAANNVKFKPKYYAGGDNMMALIAQSPPGTYDIILSDGEFVQQLNAAGYIEELNAADYPFDDMLHDDFKQFPGHWKDGKLYSMMLRGGHLGVSYNTTAMSEEEAMSYKAFWKPEIKGKVGHFDWHLPSLGQMSLTNGNGAKLWDQDDAGWAKIKETTLSLRPQVGGFFDYGGTFNGLKNGEMMAMAGIGDWITGVLERDGATVKSVVPKEGGIQFTESYSIGKGTQKAEIVKKFIQYMLSPAGPGDLRPHAGLSGLRHHQGRPQAKLQEGSQGSPAHRPGRRRAAGSDHADQGRPRLLSRHPEAAEPRGLERVLAGIQERVIPTGKSPHPACRPPSPWLRHGRRRLRVTPSPVRRMGEGAGGG